MTRTAPLQQIDLTAPSESLTYVEILTPGGMVRVNTNLVGTVTGQPAVVIEIERQVPERPNIRFQDAHAVPVGEWDIKVDDVALGARTEITLTRRPGSLDHMRGDGRNMELLTKDEHRARHGDTFAY